MLRDLDGWIRDWRAWAFLVGALVLGLLNSFLEVTSYELVVLVVPVVASAILGSTTLVVAVGVVSGAAIGIHAVIEDYDPAEARPLIVILVASILVGVLLAWFVGKQLSDVRDARDRLRFQLENSADVLFRTSHDGVFEYFTPNLAELTGWRPEELVGRPAADLVHPNDQSYLRSVQERVRGGETLRMELRILRADGSYMWMAVQLRPFRNARGEVDGRTGSWRDVSEQHAAQEALAASHRQARLLLENMTDITIHVRDDVIVWASPSLEEQLGWFPREVVGKPKSVLLDEGGVAELARMVEENETKGESRGRVRLRTREGRYHWAAARMRVFLDEDDRPDGRVTTFHLIDAEVAAERAMMRSQQLLASGLASELDPHIYLNAVFDDDHEIADLEVVEANPAAAAFFGLALDSLIGQRLRADALVDNPQALAALAHVVTTGEPVVWSEVPVNVAVSGPDRRLDLSATRTFDGISVVWRDVTDAYRARRAVAESERRFRLLAENSTDVVLHSVDGVVDWVSPSIERTLGWSPSDWEGQRCEHFVHPDDAPVLMRAYEASTGGAEQRTQIRMRNSGGDYNWVEVRSGPYLDAEGNTNGIVAAFHRIDAEVAARRELERRARYDDLTGLLKRNEVLARLDDIGSRPRHPGQLTGVLFIDLDDFKSVNDTFGHGAGDMLLKAVAQRVRNSIRAGDTVARMGGDEFLVILEGLHSLEEGEAVAEKIRLAVEQPVATDDGEVRSSASIGVTMVSPVERGDDMVARADEAMYDAKSAGRNKVIVIPDA